MNWYKKKIAMPVRTREYFRYLDWGHQGIRGRDVTEGHEEGMWVMDQNYNIKTIMVGPRDDMTHSRAGWNDQTKFIAKGRYEKINPSDPRHQGLNGEYVLSLVYLFNKKLVGEPMHPRKEEYIKQNIEKALDSYFNNPVIDTEENSRKVLFW